MRKISASEARAKLSQLLDDVDRGESLAITRRGRVIATIVPEPKRRQEEIERALEAITALRQRNGKISVEDLLSARRERSSTRLR